MPICFGYFAVSFAFGIQAAGIGLSVFEASVLSALNGERGSLWLTLTAKISSVMP